MKHKVKYAFISDNVLEELESRDVMYLAAICNNDYWKDVTIKFARGVWTITGKRAQISSRGLFETKVCWKDCTIVSTRFTVHLINKKAKKAIS